MTEGEAEGSSTLQKEVSLRLNEQEGEGGGTLREEMGSSTPQEEDHRTTGQEEGHRTTEQEVDEESPGRGER